jgi:drug/metabolite transporter (DMT)-like permease
MGGPAPPGPPGRGAQMRVRDLAALFTLAALWGGSYLFIRIAAPAFGPFPMAAVRTAVAAIVLWLGLVAFGLRPALRAVAGRLMVLGAVNAAAPFALIGFAELHLTASLAAILTATTPLWAACFGVLWLGERITVRRTAGLLLGLAGVGALVGWGPVPATGRVVLSVGAVLLAACGYALAGVYTKARLAGVPASTLAIGQQIAAMSWLAVPALRAAPRATPTPEATLALLGLAVFCTALAYPIYFRLIATIGPTRTSLTTYLIPLFGTLWGVLFLGEAVTGGTFVGLACILASVALVTDARRPGMSGESRGAEVVRAVPGAIPAIRGHRGAAALSARLSQIGGHPGAQGCRRVGRDGFRWYRIG